MGNTILLTDRGSAFRRVLVKAIAKIFKLKHVFGMTARPSTLAKVEQVNKLVYNYLQAVCKREEDWSMYLSTIDMEQPEIDIFHHISVLQVAISPCLSIQKY